jgi:hypothetical protein
MAVEEAIDHILNGQSIDAKALPAQAESTRDRLMRDVDAFANEFRTRKGNTLNEFAVDVAFVWNEKTSEVDFYLIEVQRGFAFEGLKQVDPEAASIVAERRTQRLLQARKTNLFARMFDLFGPSTNDDGATKA